MTCAPCARLATSRCPHAPSKPPAPPAKDADPGRPAEDGVAGPRAGRGRAVADGTEPGETLCGHRAISGRTCTREQGHAAKSHRYS